MDSRNFTFMFYGFAAAFLILLAYVPRLERPQWAFRQAAEHCGSRVQGSAGAANDGTKAVQIVFSLGLKGVFQILCTVPNQPRG